MEQTAWLEMLESIFAEPENHRLRRDASFELAVAWAKLGTAERAKRSLTEPGQNCEELAAEACMYALLGEAQKAADEFHRALDANPLGGHWSAEGRIASVVRTAARHDVRVATEAVLARIEASTATERVACVSVASWSLARLGAGDGLYALALPLVATEDGSSLARVLRSIAAVGHRIEDPKVRAMLLESITSDDKDAEFALAAAGVASDSLLLEAAPRARAAAPQTYSSQCIWAISTQRAIRRTTEVRDGLDVAWTMANDDHRRRAIKRWVSILPDIEPSGHAAALSLANETFDRLRSTKYLGPYFQTEVIVGVVLAIEKLGSPEDRRRIAYSALEQVEKVAAASSGDTTFLFDAVRLAITSAEDAGTADEALAERAAALFASAENFRYWTPYYRTRLLLAAVRVLLDRSATSRAFELLDRALAQPATGLDLADLIGDVVRIARRLEPGVVRGRLADYLGRVRDDPSTRRACLRIVIAA